MDKYFTYVLYSPKHDRIYIGSTDNIQLRLERHNNGKSFATKPYVPWELVYYEEFPSRSEAMIREKQLKQHAGREFIRENILNSRMSG